MQYSSDGLSILGSHFNNPLKQLYVSNKMEHLVIKVDVTYISVYILRHLKEGLVWTIHKWLQVISNVMLFNTV